MDDGTRPVDGVGHHLFTIDMQARFQAFGRVVRVPTVRRGDDRGIEALFGGEHVVDIDVAVRDVLLEWPDTVHAVRAVVVPDVANRLDMNARNVPHGSEEQLPLFAKTDQRQIDPTGRAAVIFTKPSRQRQRQSAADTRRRQGEEVAAIQRGLRNAHASGYAGVAVNRSEKSHGRRSLKERGRLAHICQ